MIALDLVRVGLLAVVVATTSLVLVHVVRQPPPTVIVLPAAQPAAPTTTVVPVPVCAYWYSGTPWSVDYNPYCGYWRD